MVSALFTPSSGARRPPDRGDETADGHHERASEQAKAIAFPLVAGAMSRKARALGSGRCGRRVCEHALCEVAPSHTRRRRRHQACSVRPGSGVRTPRRAAVRSAQLPTAQRPVSFTASRSTHKRRRRCSTRALRSTRCATKSSHNQRDVRRGRSRVREPGRRCRVEGRRAGGRFGSTDRKRCHSVPASAPQRDGNGAVYNGSQRWCAQRWHRRDADVTLSFCQLTRRRQLRAARRPARRPARQGTARRRQPRTVRAIRRAAPPRPAAGATRSGAPLLRPAVPPSRRPRRARASARARRASARRTSEVLSSAAASADGGPTISTRAPASSRAASLSSDASSAAISSAPPPRKAAVWWGGSSQY